MNVQTPKNKITNLSFMTNTKCAENEHKLQTELINNLSQLKSHPQQKIKGKNKERECKHKDNTTMCY